MTSKPHFSLLATSFAGGPRPRTSASILFGLWLLLFFAALFSPPLLDDADATHAQAARAIAQSGDLVTLHVDGVRYLEKAPLPYWLAALSFRLFGFNTFAAHLPQALAILLLVLLGHRWANQAFGSRTGFYTAVSLLTSAGVFLFTRILIPEVLLSLTLAAALFAFLKAVTPEPASQWIPTGVAIDPTPAESEPPDPTQPRAERPAEIPYAGAAFYPCVLWTSLALAVLAKGLVALVFFFASALLFLALTGDWHRWRRTRPFTGLLLFLAIAAPWHVLAALRNPAGPAGGVNGHGFLWFYFVNEHVLRFLGRRVPADYNRLPPAAYWLLHLVWLFPWSLFLPLGIAALWRRYHHQTRILMRGLEIPALTLLPVAVLGALFLLWASLLASAIAVAVAVGIIHLFQGRRRVGLELSPFHRIDPQQRSILLLALFAAVVLLFFSLSTNQEYYTFPAYLPILLLISASLTRAEQTFASDPQARRLVTCSHAALSLIGALIAVVLLFGLWTSRHLPFLADIGSVLAHREVGRYTFSMSSFFDLTLPAFAALRLPALLAAIAFTAGPTIAWLLRVQRRHLAASSTVAFTAALFLFAAHLAFARFAPLLSSKDFAQDIQHLAATHQIEPATQVMLFGDQAYGSSLVFYLDRSVKLVDARTSSMYFGSTFPDAPPIFLASDQLRASWGHGPRRIVFVPIETRAKFDALNLAPRYTLAETSGKILVTDRPLTAAAPEPAR
jgi:4-amino-4-deoxy-L-arabinose transferase-like glycosyltransferase